MKAEASGVVTIRWISIEAAALVLGVTVVTLRRAIERNCRKRPDGGVEAKLDGVVARKFGRRWRVHLGAAWTNPASGNAA